MNNKDIEAIREQLIIDTMYLVKYIIDTKIKLPTHLKTDKDFIDDLTSEGYVGLCQAGDKFKPEYKNKFKTYAYHCIKNSMVRYIKKFIKIQEKTCNYDDLDKKN